MESKQSSPPCECPAAGYCARHLRDKSADLHLICQTREDYRAAWDRDAVILRTVSIPGPEERPEPRERKLSPRCSQRGDEAGRMHESGCAHQPVYICNDLRNEAGECIPVDPRDLCSAAAAPEIRVCDQCEWRDLVFVVRPERKKTTADRDLDRATKALEVGNVRDNSAHVQAGAEILKRTPPGVESRYLDWVATNPPAPKWSLEFKPEELGGRPPKFQPSIIQYKEKILMAYRSPWDFAQVWLAELDEKFSPRWSRRIPLPFHIDARSGYEDPRLFEFRGRLFVSYNSWSGWGERKTKMMFSEISPAAEHIRQYVPEYAASREWEKNWVFFEHDGAAHAVYDIAGHRVLKLDQFGSQVVTEYISPFSGREWRHGAMRGGASPVLVGGEFYHFFHGTVPGKPRAYAIGVYTFEAKPPFAITRFGWRPLLLPDPAEQPSPGVAFVVFPCGAILRNGEWIISAGWYDATSRLYAWDVETIERELVPIPQVRPGTIDPDVWDVVSVRNEYRLPERFEAGDFIVDIGAHIGSFAEACLRRGAGRVVGIEPVPENWNLATQNLARYGERAKIFKCALSSSPTVSLTSGGDEFNTGGWHSDETGEGLKAAGFRLRDIIGRDRVRLLKLDCEGCEWRGLVGEDLSRVQEICGEWHPKNGASLPEFVALLEAAGFSVETTPESDDRFLFFAKRKTMP